MNDGLTVKASGLRTSELTGEIAKAMAAAQGEIELAPKNCINPHFKNRYADLASCRETARKALAKHSLAVIQAPVVTMSDAVVGITTRIIHESGQWLESDLCCAPRDMTPQSIGSAITYMKRYGYCAMLGIVGDDDDDGNAGNGLDPRGPQHPLPKKSPPKRAPAERTEPTEQPIPVVRAPAAIEKIADPAAPKREPGLFEGTPAQERIIAALLEKKGVPEPFWEEIRIELLGKRSTELDAVIELVRTRVKPDPRDLVPENHSSVIVFDEMPF